MPISADGSLPIRPVRCWYCGHSMIYSDDGVTPEKVHAAIAAHPLLRDDEARRMGDRLKHMPRGIDIARAQDAMKTT